MKLMNTTPWNQKKTGYQSDSFRLTCAVLRWQWVSGDGVNEFLCLSVQKHRSCQFEQECVFRSRNSVHVSMSVTDASLTRLRSPPPPLLLTASSYRLVSLHVDTEDTKCQKWCAFEDLMCRLCSSLKVSHEVECMRKALWCSCRKTRHSWPEMLTGDSWCLSWELHHDDSKLVV